MTEPSSCLFCRILAGEVPASIVYEDDDLVAFSDVNPQAPLHVLIIPRRHIATLNDLDAGQVSGAPDAPRINHDALIGQMVRRAAAIAAEHGYAESGYRTVFNCNSHAGQTVFHIHLHLLAGRPMTWPPG